MSAAALSRISWSILSSTASIFVWTVVLLLVILVVTKSSVATTFDVRPEARQRFLAETDMQLRVFDIKDIFSGAAGLNVLFEHDPLRIDYNANPDLAQARLYFEVQFDDPVLIQKSKKKKNSISK